MCDGKGCIKVYTRQPDKDSYPGGLAYSVHMAYSDDGSVFMPLNKNYGILFAKAQIRGDNTLLPLNVREPKIFSDGEGGFGIAAVRVLENGDVDEGSRGKCLLWKTKDFITFEEADWIAQEELERLGAGDCLEFGGGILERAKEYWNPVSNIQIQVPQSVVVHSGEELDRVRARAVYSDGSVAEKPVLWDKGGIDFSIKGTYQVKGKVKDKRFPFPLAKGYGDPVLFFWEGKWYYTSTNDNMNDIGLYVREADTVAKLFDANITEHLILAQDRRRELVQTFWAPEFHVIGGSLYLLFAVSGAVWGPQCHLMRLKKGCPITRADSWEDPVRVRKKDGSWLTEEGITLDMTFLKTRRQSYMVWSYRKGIGTPADTGSMLYIAEVNEEEPWRLSSDPVLLSRPLYGWENVDGTINNEGPYAFVKAGQVYLTYSGGSANSYTYVLGLLTAREDDDLLQTAAWRKRCAPVLSFYSVEGEYGPGHNSFYVDEDGDLMIAYHGETELTETLRCDGIRRVHFRRDGFPEFGMSAAEDMNDALASVAMEVCVEPVT